MSLPMPPPEIYTLIKKGVVIPACPLALDEERKFDERHQKALLRYYVAAGVGGVAVGVHTTQFEIRDPGVGLFEPLLALAAETLDAAAREQERPVLRVAGVCGRTAQAVAEAETAAALGYHVALLSLSAFPDATDEELIRHCRTVTEIMPLMGFYLQPAVGGRVLAHSFWRRFVEIENVVAIKIAPFNRYQTLDVVRAVAMAARDDQVILYTGNDDNILMDLLTPYHVQTGSETRIVRIRGGLLGQWSIWTRRAVELLDEIHGIVDAGADVPLEMLRKSVALTDANAVVFDAAHGFAGCIPGIHEVLRRQGLLRSTHCLDPKLGLSPGQSEEIDRVYRDYPYLTDDEFVKQHLDEWLGEM